MPGTFVAYALAGFVVVPVCAYFDSKILKRHKFVEYFGICLWEYGLVLIGFLLGAGKGAF